MGILIAGVLGWSLIHLMPALAPSFKASLVNRLGTNGYKLAFTLGILASLGLIIWGWRSTEPVFLYHFSFARHLTYLLMVVALACIIGAKSQSHLCQWLRHPQLTGVFLWSGAHLLVNGDQRSLILFGSFALWTILEMFLINRRDGKPSKVVNASVKEDVKLAVKTLVAMVVFVLIHPFLSGVALVRIGG
ncbi:MAG: NnrU family protein [Ketobacteraceae bacterium]|nr:NnrU family protein [Ketobacteraceae bacterium]